MKSADKTRMSNTFYTKSFARKAGGFFNSLFLPDVCCICGDIIKNFEDVPKKIKFRGINGKCFDCPYCEFCTRDLERALGPWRRTIFPDIPDAIFLFDYTYETIKRSLHHIKICKCTKCTAFFAGVIKDYVYALAGNDGFLTYIPRSVRLYEKYGFDQSERIVRTLVLNHPDIRYQNLFRRRKNIDEQKDLPFEERFNNAEKALEVIKENGSGIPGRIVVFDDIITTGATAKAAAKLLKKSEAGKIFMLFVAGTNEFKERS